MIAARRILVIRLGAVGDVVRTMIALGPLRRLAPPARISWIAEEGPASLLRGHPALDEVIELPRHRLDELFSEPSGFFSGVELCFGLAAELRAREFDLSIDFHGTFKSGLVALAAGAPVRYGYAPPGSKEGNRFFNTHHVPLPAGPLHRIERNLRMMRALAAGDTAAEATPRIELPITAAHRQHVGEWLRSTGAAGVPLVLVYPGTSRRQAYKRYPAADLASVVEILLSRRAATVVVAGGPGEEDLVRHVAGLTAQAPPRGVLIAPRLDLLELAALIERCDLFIGPDTGPMHIAWAVGTPVLALFGPTDPALNAPWGPGHTVLYNAPSRGHGGARWSTPDEVCSAAVAMLDRPGDFARRGSS